MSTTGARARRPPPWRDVRVLRVLLQVVFVAAVLALFAYLSWILSDNMRDRGLTTGYEYIEQPAGFAIPNSDFSSGASFATALRYDVKNTAIVAGSGIVLATLLGVAVGIARLSSNWLLRKAAAVYVETLRNIPVLLIIFLWYFGVILKLPRVERAYEWLDAIVLSNRGLSVPSLTAPGGAAAFAAVVAVAAVAAIALA